MTISEYLDGICDLWAVARLDRKEDDFVERYGKDILKYPYAIVIGHRLDDDICEIIPLMYDDDVLAQRYMDKYYSCLEDIHRITEKVEENIRSDGYKSITLDVSGKNEKLDLKSGFNNKLSARLSGAGWIGKNNLIITEKFGPRLTWATVLTDYPLEDHVGSPQESLCGDCRLCSDACPADAISNTVDCKKSYDAEKCGNYLKSRKNEGHPMICGMCLYVCPFGNEKSE